MERTPEPKTRAERMLALYFEARGWLRGPEWEYEPQFEGRRRRPDFRLRLGGWKLMLEVKEFGRAESAPDGPRRGCHARIAAKIHLAERQMREFQRDHLCAAVLCSGTDADADVADPLVTMGALLGDPTFREHQSVEGVLARRPRYDLRSIAAVLTLSEVKGAIAVTVLEHPFALRSFPSHLFQAAWDVRWELREDGPARTFAGAGWRATEALQTAQSAA